MKKLISLLLVAIMLTSMLPVMAQDTNSITVTFSAYDSMNYQFAFMPQEIKVAPGTAAKYGFENSADYIGEGQISVMDAFVAAHELLYGADEINSKWQGLDLAYVTMMFGIEGSIGFMINNEYAYGIHISTYV